LDSPGTSSEQCKEELEQFACEEFDDNKHALFALIKEDSQESPWPVNRAQMTVEVKQVDA